jgi:predicted phosphodiesterase
VRVAALYDVHGMLAALESVLAGLEHEEVDAVVLGGDVVGGPQPAETLARLRELELPQHWLRGNGERALGVDGDRATRAGEALEFSAERLPPDERELLAALPETLALEVDGLGRVLFCHAIPNDDDFLITEETTDEHVARAAEGVAERTIVCGHTHMQYDRTVDGTRWINVGSVGMPFEGEVAAFWAVLGPDLQLRRTPIDVDRAARELLASGWPDAESFVEENLRRAVTRREAIDHFERVAVERGQRD